jgi:hypothetical protein
VIGRDLVTLRSSRVTDAGPGVPEGNRRNRPDAMKFLVFRGDDADREAVRCRRGGNRPVEHQQRMRLHLQASLGGGRRHVRCGLLDPLERFRDDQLTLARSYRPDCRGGEEGFGAPQRPGVVRPARPRGDEEHQRPVLLGPGPVTRDSVTEGVYPLNDLVISHGSAYLTMPGKVLQLCLPGFGCHRAR